MTALRRAVTGFLLLKLSVLTLNLFGFPVLRRLRHANLRAASSVAETRPSVSLLVPMRNEAARLAASVPAMLGQNADEIIVLDDESTDGTGALARSLLGPHPRARVRTGAPAPSGWVGKNWACQQLAAEASGSLLVYCDADVLLAEGAVDAVITEMRAQHADVFSVFPRQITATLGERLITPLIDDVLLCFPLQPAVGRRAPGRDGERFAAGVHPAGLRPTGRFRRRAERNRRRRSYRAPGAEDRPEAGPRARRPAGGDADVRRLPGGRGGDVPWPAAGDRRLS